MTRVLMMLRVPPQRVVRTGPLVIDLDGKWVTVDGHRVELSGREWNFLAYLAERVGQFCSNEEILAGAFGPEWVTGDRHRDQHSLIIPLGRLRKKLGPTARHMIANVTHHLACGRRLEMVTP